MRLDSARALEILRWLLTSPGLLRPTPFTPSLVSDEELRALLPLITPELGPRLEAVLQPAIATRRLGRVVETLTAFMVQEFLEPSFLELSVPIREGKRTVGELDLLFDRGGTRAEHWELSVKFYICLKDDSRDLRDFMGTFVEDRLDRKLAHLFRDQLPLVESPEARAELATRGWKKPFMSRALMKGLFFYPASGQAWRSNALDLPDEIAPHHDRGWWTTSSELNFPKVGSGVYMVLGHLDWLSRFEGLVPRSSLMTEADLQTLCREYFDGDPSDAWLRRREMTVAEVEIEIAPSLDDATSEQDRVNVREVARGHIVHAKWPALARWAAERTINELESSQRSNSKRALFASTD